MCFIIESDHIADKEVVCFKVLMVEDGTLRSPYFHKKWELRKEEVQKLNNGEITHCGRKGGESVIEKYTIDGLYACVNKKSAKRLLRFIKSKTRIKLKIFKCIIPKGSKYFVGLDELCSEKLIIKRQLIFNLI